MVYDGLDFYLDGTSAKSKGIIMQAEPIVSPIQAEIETFNVPGRAEGPLHASYGTYKERTITIPCYAIGYDDTRDDGYYRGGDGVYATMQTIIDFLFPAGAGQLIQPRKLKFGWNNKKFLVFVTSGAELNARLKTLNPFNVEFLLIREYKEV